MYYVVTGRSFKVIQGKAYHSHVAIGILGKDDVSDGAINVTMMRYVMTRLLNVNMWR